MVQICYEQTFVNFKSYLFNVPKAIAYFILRFFLKISVGISKCQTTSPSTWTCHGALVEDNFYLG